MMVPLAFAMLLMAPSGAEPAAAPGPRAEAGTEASISLFHRRRIRDFVRDPERDDGLYLQDQRRNWYYARLTAPCPELISAFAIGVDTYGTSRMDRFSEIVVRGNRCTIASLTHSPPPPQLDRD